jgi:hypothetical protein
VTGGVAEGEPCGFPEKRLRVLQLPAVRRGRRQDLLLGGCQDAVHPPQDGKRQDHVLVLAPLERVADRVRPPFPQRKLTISLWFISTFLPNAAATQRPAAARWSGKVVLTHISRTNSADPQRRTGVLCCSGPVRGHSTNLRCQSLSELSIG